jgi:hypothetical protein
MLNIGNAWAGHGNALPFDEPGNVGVVSEKRQ